MKLEDSTLDDVVYGRQFSCVIGGRVVKRLYREKYCKGCGAFIDVRLVKSGPKANQLPASSQHNKREFCCRECLDKYNTNNSNTKPQMDTRRAKMVEEVINRFLYSPANHVSR
jgi:hypothetical protein